LSVELNGQIIGFHKSRRITRRFARTIFRGDRRFNRWCFSNLATAREFAEQFDGVFYKTTGA
jgi:hypothetical protein